MSHDRVSNAHFCLQTMGHQVCPKLLLKNDHITKDHVQYFGAAQDPFVKHVIKGQAYLTKGSCAHLKCCTRSYVMCSFVNKSFGRHLMICSVLANMCIDL